MKLHLGCGKRYLNGYIHIDKANYDHIDYISSVDTLDMIEDDSCKLVYASHVLEYFDRNEVQFVLSEWQRVLKKNGILRIAVPDFKSLVKIYGDTKELNNIIGPLYGRWDTSKEVIYHKTVYDEVSLTKVLEAAGFSNIEKWDWSKVFSNEYDDHSQAYFPHMDKKSGIHVSLNIQCSK